MALSRLDLSVLTRVRQSRARRRPVTDGLRFFSATTRLPDSGSPSALPLRRVHGGVRGQVVRVRCRVSALLRSWKDAATPERHFGSVVWRLSRHFEVVAGQGVVLPKAACHCPRDVSLGTVRFAVGRAAAGCGLPLVPRQTARRSARATRRSRLLPQRPRTYQRARQRLTLHGVPAMQSGTSPCLPGEPPPTDPAKANRNGNAGKQPNHVAAAPASPRLCPAEVAGKADSEPESGKRVVAEDVRKADSDEKRSGG